MVGMGVGMRAGDNMMSRVARDKRVHTRPDEVDVDASPYSPGGALPMSREDRAKQIAEHPFQAQKYRALAYLLYLVAFLAASLFARPTITIFQQNRIIYNIFSLDGSNHDAPAAGTGQPFEHILSVQDWWAWMDHQFAPAIHRKDLRPGSSNERAETGHMSLQLITAPKIRQVRVQPVECDADVFRTVAVGTRCFPTLSEGSEDTEPFGPSNRWKWTAAEHIVGYDHSVSGEFAVFGTSGYILPSIAASTSELQAQFMQLREDNWTGLETRLIVIDLALWNPSQRLVSSVKLHAEVTPVGRVLPTVAVKTFEFKKWIDLDRWYWYWEVLFVALVFIYSLEEGKECLNVMKTKATEVANEEASENQAAAMVKAGLRLDLLLEEYFADPWNIMDVINYVLAIIVIAIEVQARVQLHSAVELINEAYGNMSHTGTTVSEDGLASGTEALNLKLFFSNHVDLAGPAYNSERAYKLMGVNAIITWLKLLKYLNTFPSLAMLSKTLTHAFHPVRDFSIMFFIVFLGAGHAFNMAFGCTLQKYSTPGGAMISLFRSLLGDFEYYDLQRTDPVAAPILFVGYVLLVGFVLLNMYIAIIAEAYEKAKVEVFGDFQVTHRPKWKNAISLVEYVTLSIRGVFHQACELPVQILKHGCSRGNEVAAQKKLDKITKLSTRRLSEPLRRKISWLGTATPKDTHKDDDEKTWWSTSEAVKEILKQNRELLDKLSAAETHPDGKAGKIALAKRPRSLVDDSGDDDDQLSDTTIPGDTDDTRHSPQKSASGQLVGLVREQQLSVGESQLPHHGHKHGLNNSGDQENVTAAIEPDGALTTPARTPVELAATANLQRSHTKPLRSMPDPHRRLAPIMSQSVDGFAMRSTLRSSARHLSHYSGSASVAASAAGVGVACDSIIHELGLTHADLMRLTVKALVDVAETQLNYQPPVGHGSSGLADGPSWTLDDRLQMICKRLGVETFVPLPSCLSEASTSATPSRESNKVPL